MEKRRNGRAGKIADGRTLPVFPDRLVLPPEPPIPDAPISDRDAWRHYYEACVARTKTLHGLLRRHARQRMTAAAARSPLHYRQQHPALSDDRAPVVARDDRQIQDAEGRPGDPRRSFDTLAALHRRGSIGDAELAAGRRFEEDFRRAMLDPLRASDLSRIPGQPGADLSEKAHQARAGIERLLQALGGRTSPVGSCVWAVLGEGRSLRDFAQSTVFGSGRSMSEKAASWTLIGGLGILVSVYGLEHRASP